MFTFTKKLAIAVKKMALSSGQFMAFCSKYAHDEDDNTNKQLVVVDN